jgi:phosphoglycolate phosphatase-like HAD superfamily hydrolase
LEHTHRHDRRVVGAPDAPVPLLVLWDVDHTLIDNGGVSKEVYAATFHALTGELPVHPVLTEGRTEPEIVRNLLVRHGRELQPEQVAELVGVLAAVLDSKLPQLRERGRVLPGAEAALHALWETPGVIQSVLTGNVRPNAICKLAAFGLDPYLDFEVGGYGSDHPVRPTLVGIARQRATAKYGVPFGAFTTVLIGDTPRDVQAGRLGGAYVVAVATGVDGQDELRAEGADVVLGDLRDTEAVVAAVLGARTRRAGKPVAG